MNLLVIIICSSLFFSGCAKLAHIDQLLTLKAISENKDTQTKFVEQQDKNFEKIRQAYQENKLGEYPDAPSVRKAFGEPVTIREEMKDGQKRIKWLYRYSVKMLKSDKIYLFYSSDGKLLEWQYVEAPQTTLKEPAPPDPAAAAAVQPATAP